MQLLNNHELSLHKARATKMTVWNLKKKKKNSEWSVATFTGLLESIFRPATDKKRTFIGNIIFNMS